MLTINQCAGFLGVALLLTLAPGPDNLMVLATSVAHGARRGIAFGLGCALGCLNHTLLAALGISALIAASAYAYEALRMGGGVYLLWLGIQAWRKASSSATFAAAPAPAESAWRLFWRGLLANAINPKVILFFLALLPQFVHTENGHIAWQIAQLGMIFSLLTALVFSLIGLFAGRFGAALRRRPGFGVLLDRLAATVFATLGLRLLAVT